MRCRDVMIDPGGGGINVSRAISLLGGTGRSIGSMLSEEAVKSTLVSTAGTNRPNFASLVQKSGQQFRFARPGPEINEEEWDTGWQRDDADS